MPGKEIPEVIYLLKSGMDIGRRGESLVVFNKTTKKLVSPAFKKWKNLVKWVRATLMTS